jgi:hypothetical protein
MWMEKLAEGVLRVLTPLGPRYVKPSCLQRIYLLWVFRNFHTLPVTVLSAGQKRRIENMCRRYGFLSQLGPNEVADFAVLGTLEQRPPVEENLPLRRPAVSVRDSVAPFAADAQQGS